MLLLFLKIMMIQIPKMFGVKQRSNRLKNYEDFMIGSLDALLYLINIREGNISCDGFTGEEINFMIYDICVH